MVYLGQIIEQSFLFFPLALGIYLSFTILRIADLTVDGSFILGAALFARIMQAGFSAPVALAGAIFGGALAGFAVALIQRRNRIDPLIAGILMAFMLYSLTLIIMQRPNIGLLGFKTLLSGTASFRLLALGGIGLALSLGLGMLLASKFGLRLKAFGNNQNLLAMMGFNAERLRLVGLGLSNALVALSGSLTAQASGYADINMGFGQALVGIAMILVSRQLIHLFQIREHRHALVGVAFTFLGVFLYFLLTNEVIRWGLSPIYLKMAIGAFLVVFLLLSSDRAIKTRSSLA